MIGLIIFNTIVSLSVVGYVTYVYFPFYFRVNRTFWCGKPYSVTLWMRTSGTRLSRGSSARGIFTLPFRDEEKLEEWDSKMFHNGEYKKYKKPA